jgi:uncharacterized membrane protein YesL
MVFIYHHIIVYIIYIYMHFYYLFKIGGIEMYILDVNYIRFNKVKQNGRKKEECFELINKNLCI